MDGWVTIGFKGDLSQLKKDRDKAQNELTKWQKDNEKLTEQKIEIEAEVKINEEKLKKQYEIAKDTLSKEYEVELASWQGSPQVIEQEFDTKRLKLDEEYMANLDKEEAKIEDINKKLEESSNKQAILTQRVEETSNAYELAKNKSDISSEIQKSSKKMTSLVKQAGRWALALVSIRSLYGMLSNAASQLNKTNKQTKTDLDYLKYSIAVGLEPIITRIVNFALSLLSIINTLIFRMTGFNLFSKSTADNFKKASGSAKQINKSLAGFDEMNIVSSGASGGAGVGTPSVDLSKIQGNIPKWMQWILDNGGTVAGLISGIAGAIVALKLSLDPLIVAGLVLIGLGIGMLIDDVLKAIQDPSWQNWVNVLMDVAIIVGGIMLLFGSWWGLIVAGIALVVKVIMNNWDSIASFFSKIGQWIYDNVLLPVWNFIKAVGDTIWSYIKLIISIFQGIFTAFGESIANIFDTIFTTIKNVISKVFDAVKNIVDGIKKLFSGDLKGALESFKSAFKNVFGALWEIAKSPLNLIIGGINALIKGVNKIKFDVPDWIPGIGGKKWGFNLKEIPKLAKGGIINLPGKGVAIGGEAGKEGVLPLTDSQQMELLGEAIGRHITINLTSNTNLDGRTISRKTEQIKQNKDFAFNR